MAQSKGYRVEIKMTELTYRGDRDERLVVFEVAGEDDESPNLAISKACRRMELLDYPVPLSTLSNKPVANG